MKDWAMKPSLARACLIVLVTVAAGCGGAADDTTSTTPQAGNTQTSAGGSTGGNGAPPSVSDDFAVDIPDGWQIDLLGEIGMTNTSGVQLLYPADSFTRVVDFYDDWTESQDKTFTRSEDGDLVTFLVPGVTYTISITRGHESHGQTWTLLQVAAPPEG